MQSTVQFFRTYLQLNSNEIYTWKICFEMDIFFDGYKVVKESETLLLCMQLSAFLNAVCSMRLGLPATIDD